MTLDYILQLTAAAGGAVLIALLLGLVWSVTGSIARFSAVLGILAGSMAVASFAGHMFCVFASWVWWKMEEWCNSGIVAGLVWVAFVLWVESKAKPPGEGGPPSRYFPRWFN